MSAIDNIRLEFMTGTTEDPGETPEQRAARFDSVVGDYIATAIAGPPPLVPAEAVNSTLAALKGTDLKPEAFVASIRLLAGNTMTSGDNALALHELADKIAAAVAPLPEQNALNHYADLLEAHSDAEGWDRAEIVADLREFACNYRDIISS